MIKILFFSFFASAAWKAEVVPPRSPVLTGFHEIEIRLQGEDLSHLKGAEVTLEGNMAHPGMVPVYGKAVPIAPGRFKGRLEFTMKGDWRITAHIRFANGETLEQSIDLLGVK